MLNTTKPERRCHKCGCTDADCRQCIAKTGYPCHWVDEDFCSRCADELDAKIIKAMDPKFRPRRAY